MQIRIAEVIRANRKIKGLTQESLAEMVGTSTSFIGQLERDEAYPSMPILAKLIDVLGIDANTLFYKDVVSTPFNEITIRVSRLSPDKQDVVLRMLNVLDYAFERTENDHEDSHMRR